MMIQKKKVLSKNQLSLHMAEYLVKIFLNSIEVDSINEQNEDMIF